MWSAEEFNQLLERKPEGGTLWTRTHRTVRYVRIFRPDNEITVAIMTEHSKGRSPKVLLFVKTPSFAQTSELDNASRTSEFLRRILENPIFSVVHCRFHSEIKKFLSFPDKTVVPTW